MSEAPWRTSPPLIGIRFEENRGQLDSRARFVARSGDLSCFVTDRGAMLVVRRGDQGAAVGLHLADANGNARATSGEAALETRSHYFRGRDPGRWRTNVPSYRRVRQTGVLPGVDVVYHGDNGRLEYDVVVAPGVDPRSVAMDVEGGDALQVLGDGSLEIAVGDGVFRQAPPRVYQDDAGGRHPIAARYRLVGGHRVAFDVAAYDRSRDLVIDPTLEYSSRLGGTSAATNERANAVAIDGTGAAYVALVTESTDMPATVGAFRTTSVAAADVFVAKISPAGNTLVYATYLGGTAPDTPSGIAVDGAGAAYVVGVTGSNDFPLVGAIQATNNGAGDAFVTKISAAGDALGYSTYLGGAFSDIASAVAVTTGGVATVGGQTSSTDFPTAAAAQPALGNAAGSSDGFVARLAADGASLVFSTFLGGSLADNVAGVAVDTAGAAYAVGATSSTNFPVLAAFQATNAGDSDATLTKLDATGARVFATYLGGTNLDQALAVGLDGTGAIYMAGNTVSTNFPTQSPLQATRQGQGSAFVTKFNAAGSALTFSTYLGGATAAGGGPGDTLGIGLGVDGTNSVHVLVETFSVDLPMVNPLQGTLGGSSDFAIARFAPSGTSLLQSTYFGGTGIETAKGIAVSAGGDEYVVGASRSADFQTRNPVLVAALNGDEDPVVFKLSPSDAGVDAGSDGGTDAGTDAGPDAGSDAGTDAGRDAGQGADASVRPDASAPSDAAPPDAARGDASTSPSEDSVGGGACACRTAPTPGTERDLLGLTTALALTMALVRRRVRSARTDAQSQSPPRRPMSGSTKRGGR